MSSTVEGIMHLILENVNYSWENMLVETAAKDRAKEAERSPRDELAESLIVLSFLLQDHIASTARSFGLTQPQAWALRILENAQPMRELASAMGCDASNVTGIVDRLEPLGLVRRRVDDRDRRVKLLEVTPEGRALRRRLERRLLAGIRGLDALDRNEARTALAFVTTVNSNFGH
jgi:DNA-binding MarR family transcriptional regulator